MHPESRPAVVLLHSSGSSGRQWQALAETLKPRFRVHAIDFHGHGERAAWSGVSPLTLADEAALARSVLADLGDAHVIGHSYGGAVALKLATRFPEHVRSVVAYEPVLFRWLMDDVAHRQPVQEFFAIGDVVREHLNRGDAHSAAQRFVDYWSGPGGAWASLPPGKQDAVAARMHSVMRHFDALANEPLQLAHLARLPMPMMFLSGARTVTVAQRLARVLHSALPFALHEVLPAMGHMGPITHAAEVNRRLVAFLDSQSAADHGAERPLKKPLPAPHTYQPLRAGVVSSVPSSLASTENAAQRNFPAGSRLPRCEADSLVS